MYVNTHYITRNIHKYNIYIYIHYLATTEK